MGLLAFAAPLALAEPRLALLIGNQNYSARVGPLKNPRQDVALIEASLKSVGFQVTVLMDADYRAMDVALKRYAADLRRAGPGALGFFYYSGHGAANAETQINYLIPVDVASAEDETLWYQSFQQNQIIDLLSKQAPNATQFVVFDACRNELHLSGGAAKSIGADKGFVPVANAAGLLIAYATAPNRTASDLGDGGGPYARALAEEILKPGIEAVTMFRNVQIKVKQTIGQDPWLSFPSLPPVFFGGGENGSVAAQAAQPGASVSDDARAWTVVQNTQSEAVLEEFLRRFPDGVYAGFAKARLEELRKTHQASNVPKSEPSLSKSKAEACGDGIHVSVAQSNGKSCIKPGSGTSFKDCPECPEMVVAPAGSFVMGSPDTEPERESFERGSESPQHKVGIKEPFAVGRFAVTVDEFETFVREGGYKVPQGCNIWTGKDWKLDAAKSFRSPGFPQTGSHPVVCVSWNDAKAYVQWLSRKTGKPYRLLSEAEREYVTRAGTATPFWWGSSITTAQANYNGDFVYAGGGKGEFRKGTVPVKSFQPNPWGLYQVHGNVWDWVEDCWNENYNGAPSDGSARTSGDCDRRALRGGSWIFFPRLLRAAFRSVGNPSIGSFGTGFRVARSLE
jgi:formylglycine-generating enzyme required for sulfatase activity